MLKSSRVRLSIPIGRGGIVYGSERIFWYSSTLMSEVKVKAFRPWAAGGKSGIVKVWRGIWAPWAWDGSTGSPGMVEGFVVAIVDLRRSGRIQEEEVWVGYCGRAKDRHFSWMNCC